MAAQRRSLSARITLGASVVLAIFIALSAYALERAFRDSARSARQDRLLAQVYLLMAAAEVNGQGSLTLSTGALEPKFDLPGSGLYAAVTDGDGQVVWRSRSALATRAPYERNVPAGTQRFSQSEEDGAARYFLQSFGVSWTTIQGSYPFTFSVAEDLAPYREQLATYRRSLWGWLGAMAVLLLVVQWRLLRWGLSPLRKVADELTRLERGEQQNIAGDYPAEVERLTDNLNSVLDHERAQQKRYREALADLAHSLKTPLAVVRGALYENSDEARRILEEQVERMDRIVGYHLQRAAASGRSRLSTPQAVAPAVQRIVDALAKVYADKQIEFTLLIPPEVRLRGDEGDLTEMLGNLLDNACKWCRQRVRVSAQADSRQLVLTVEDDGPGIVEADAQRVLQRGVRADQAMPGQGIGLTVTRDIAEAYDGSISIARSEWGGAAVSLLLPGTA